MGFEARVRRVTPRTAIDFSMRIPRCYCGVSLTHAHDNFEGARLSALIEWLASHSERCRLVIGDDLHRWNVMIWDGLLGVEALRTARNRGEEFLKTVTPLLSRYSDRQFEVVYWRELANRPVFSSLKREISHAISLDVNLADCLRTSAHCFIDRQLRRGHHLQTSFERAVEYSQQYIVEEVAVFGLLGAEGWQVDVYPGQELPLLTRMTKCKSPAIPKTLLKRVNVELKLHPTSS